jgi:hypothetical protein
MRRRRRLLLLLLRLRIKLLYRRESHLRLLLLDRGRLLRGRVGVIVVRTRAAHVDCVVRRTRRRRGREMTSNSSSSSGGWRPRLIIHRRGFIKATAHATLSARSVCWLSRLKVPCRSGRALLSVV